MVIGARVVSEGYSRWVDQQILPKVRGMDSVGVAFKSRLSGDQVRERYVRPLREALEDARAGIYTNYLRLPDGDAWTPTQSPTTCWCFWWRDFEAGLRLLRMTLQGLAPADEISLHNLNPSPMPY